MKRTDCVYDATRDLRRKVAAKHTREELERQQNLLDGILATIRYGDDEATKALINVIRNNTSLEKIGEFIEDSSDRTSVSDTTMSPKSPEMPDDRPPPRKRTRSDAHFGAMDLHFINEPPIVLCAEPWTDVAEDNVVSHLLSIYFAWDQPFVAIVDKIAFLHDMKHSVFNPKGPGACSPLLVNAILAEACVCTLIPLVVKVL